MLTIDFGKKGRTPLETLLNAAKLNSAYDQDVLDALSSNEERIKYLEMLSTANTLALNNRIAADGYDYASIEDKRLKFQVLETEYELAIQERLANDEAYQASLDAEYNKQINSQFAADERITGNSAIKTIVDTKHSGDYSAFMSGYTDADAFFQDEYLAYADQYDEQETRDILKYMQEQSAALKAKQDMTAPLLERKAALLENVKLDAKQRIERIAYENASWIEKAGASAEQILLAPITELGNVLEGVIDAVATLASGTLAAIGKDDIANQLKDFVAADTIPLDTMLAEALPYSYITSPYAADNPLRWLYEIETSIIDMAPMALNIIAPGVGTIIYYTSSAGRTAEGYINEYSDADIGEIVTYTAVSTAIECLTEKISGDVVFGKGFTDKWTKKIANKPILAFLKESMGEGIEEVASEIGSQLTASILRGENKFDGKQILRAGAMGAATSVFLQGGNKILTRRRILGINTKLTNAETGMSVNLSKRESAIHQSFMNNCKTKLDEGKQLSKRDAEMYERFKKFDQSSHIDKDRLNTLTETTAEPTATTVDRTQPHTKSWYETTYELEVVDGRNTIHPRKVKVTETVTPERAGTNFVIDMYNGKSTIQQKPVYTDKITRLYEAIDAGLDDAAIDEIAMQLVDDTTTETINAELQQMGSVWMNSLLAGDENSQDVLNAVNNYYNQSLSDIADRLEYQTSRAHSVYAPELSRIIGANVTMTTDSDKNSLHTQLRTAFISAYPGYQLFTYVTDSNTAPVVSVYNNRVYVNHKYLRDTNITSVIKQIEMQIETDLFYGKLNVSSKARLNELRTKMHGNAELTVERAQQLDKQIVYSALFVPGNDLSIQLSELDNATYQALRTEFEARAKEQNVAIKNVAYRGLEVYDLTILERLSADEATEKKLLSNNFAIDELNSRRGPDKARHTFKYGVDASTAGVRVLSAIRHLRDQFGLVADTSNFYQALSDIQNSDKYKNFETFKRALNIYGDIPTKQAINLYLRDQFDFEIDARGNIIATTNVNKLLDADKVTAAFVVKKPIALTDILTPMGKQVLPSTDCIVAFVDNLGKGEHGDLTTSVTGKGLIRVDANEKVESQFHTLAHELQHFLTRNAHQAFGASQLFSGKFVNTVYSSLSNAEKTEFLRAALNFTAETQETMAQFKKEMESDDDLQDMLDQSGRISSDILKYIHRAIYFHYDVDEQQSNFKIERADIDATGMYFKNTGAGPAVFNIHASDKLSKAAYDFLKYFDGKSMLLRSADVDAVLSNITNGTTTFDALLRNEEVVTETSKLVTTDTNDFYTSLEKVLALSGTKPTTKQLCQPQYWASLCTDENLRARASTFTPADCKRLVTNLTGRVYDEYRGEFVAPEDTFKPAEYVKYIDTDAIVLQRDGNTIIQLPRDFTPNRYKELTRTIGALSETDRNSAVYYVDDRLFANVGEALRFINTLPVSAAQTLNQPDNASAMIIDQLIDMLPVTGFNHSADFALITHDGKVVSYNSEGKPGEVLKAFAKKANISWNTISRGLQVDLGTGELTGNLESGVMKRLLDAKKVVRAYRVGDTWEAYGKPNYVQDLVMRQMSATNKQISYLTPDDVLYKRYIPGKARLVTDSKGRVGIDRDGRFARYPEVSWKDNTWYAALMQIIEKYDIRTIDELKQLGFNDDFIAGIKRNYGRGVQAGTAGKLGLGAEMIEKTRKYSGLQQDVINQFINDTSAHTLARNLLIQNSQARQSTENLNWTNCSHIRSIEDVDAYLNAISQCYGTLMRKQNFKKYDSLNELIADAKKEYIKGDEKLSPLFFDPEDVTKRRKTDTLSAAEDASYTNIVSLFLNLDSRQESKTTRIVKGNADQSKIGTKRVYTPEGLDYSLSGFQVAVNAITRGYADARQSADSVKGKTMSIETKAHGRHVDDESTLSKVDAAAAKGMLDNGLGAFDAITDGPEDSVYRKGVTTALQYITEGKPNTAVKSLEKLKSWLSQENDRQNQELGETGWDTNLGSLYTKVNDLIGRIAIETDTKTESHPVDTFISEAKDRIEKSADKRKAQDAEYQLLTNNRQRMIQQYGEKAYKRALDALSTSAILGESTGMSNVKDNISKRLRDSGSASIYARIDKMYTGPAATKLKSLADNLKNMNDFFKGVKPGTEGYSDMRFRYSNLLTAYYNFVKEQSTEAFSKIKEERKAIADYLDNLVLSGNYAFDRIAKPEIAIYTEVAEQLASGEITLPEFESLKNASFDQRIATLQAIIDSGIQSGFPRQVIDRMQKLLDDAQIPTESSSLKDRPRIDLSVLKLAQDRAGLSADTTSALTDVVNKLNQEYKENRNDKAKMSEMRQQLEQASTAVFNAKYLNWSYDRLSKEYRRYLNSPAITQPEAEALIRHAALMIENADYQSRTNVFSARARDAWKNETGSGYERDKALLYYRDHKTWPKGYAAPVRGVDPDNPSVGGTTEPFRSEIESAERAYKQYIKTSVEAQARAAFEARSAADGGLLSSLTGAHVKARDKFARRYRDEQLAAITYTIDGHTYTGEEAIYQLALREYTGSYSVEDSEERARAITRNKRAKLLHDGQALWMQDYQVKRNAQPKSVSTTLQTAQPKSVPSKSLNTGVESVNDLLQMYAKATEFENLAIDDIPITEQYYIVHRTLSDLLERAEKTMAKYKTSEETKLNGIVNGVDRAVTEFQYRPMTLASATKFIMDVRSILQDGTFNQSLFSWKNGVSINREFHTAFDTFEQVDGKREAKGTSVTAINNLLKRLKSGEFTSHAQELEQELQQSADQIGGAINSLVQESLDDLTEEDRELDSNISQQMRQDQESDWAGELPEIADDLQTDWDAAITAEFGEVQEESSKLLADDEFEYDFGDDSDYGLSDEIIPPLTEKSKPVEKKSKTDDRPLDEQFKPEDEAGRSSYKTTRSELLTRNGVDISRALEYQFQNTATIDIYGQEMTRQRANTQEFITNPEVSKILQQLLNNEAAMKDFLAWLADARAMDEITSLKALIILNKIEASPTIPLEIRRDAEKIRRYKKSIAGAILGLGNRHGLTPVEEVNMLAMEMLKLTDDERLTLKAISDRQEAAIEAKDFKAADIAMQEALEIFKKHQHELDININPFGKTESSDAYTQAKQRLAQATTANERRAAQDDVDALRIKVDEERAVRWHNLTNKITTWRYFAMLSAPSTFFAKNVVGNYVAQGLNRVSLAFASAIETQIAKKRGFKYTLSNRRASEAAQSAVKTQLIDNGIIDGILSSTVAKYETGYAYRPSAIRNLTIDSLKDDLGPDKYATLAQLIRPDAPFGKMNTEGKTNVFAAGLNKMYSIIFGTMDKYDKKFMRTDIIRMTERLVSDNFTADEITALNNKTADEALLNKFYEIVEFSRQEALKTYFRSQPKIYNELMNILNKHPLAQAVVSTIMPFPRMVMNATMTALAYSPLGFIKGVMTLKHDASMFANIRASQELGKACTGTIAIFVGAILAAIGILDIDDEDKYAGPQLAIGDLRIALEGLEPSSVAFITGAMTVLGPKYGNANGFAAAADALLDSTILGEMMSQFGNDDTGTKWIGGMFSAYVTQFIPTIVRRLTQVIDPGKKDYTGKAKTLKRIGAAIPFVSLAVDNKIDPYTGDAKVQYTDSGNAFLARFFALFNTISPTKVTWDGDSDVEIESKAVGAATTGPAKTIRKDGTEYEIPKKLYNKYRILRAQLYSQYAGEVIKTEAYQKLSNEKKAKWLSKLQTQATNEARKQLNIESELNIP